MNKIIAFVVVLATLFSYANENVYMLKYDAYAWMLDKNGKKLKSGRFKAGTKFTIIVDDEVRDMLGVIREKQVVKTDPTVGLSDSDSEKIIKILNWKEY